MQPPSAAENLSGIIPERHREPAAKAPPGLKWEVISINTGAPSSAPLARDAQVPCGSPETTNACLEVF